MLVETLIRRRLEAIRGLSMATRLSVRIATIRALR